MIKVLSVVGNRPQFVKAAAISRKLRAAATEVLVHTGQHHDNDLSQVFFDQFDLPSPDHYLGIGGGSNSEQTARMLTALEAVYQQEQPRIVLVYGDTNSTLAGALVASQYQVPIAHVEAGMRSFDRAMPEENNRVVTDHLSSLLLCSTETAIENLKREGISGQIEYVGDVMADVAIEQAPLARERTEVLDRYGVTAGEYTLITLHRAGNVDTPEALTKIVDVLIQLESKAVFPVHPRTRARLVEFGLLERLEQVPNLRIGTPVNYRDFLTLLLNAKAMLTDSGGVQKEAYIAGVRCTTLRPSTEWVETVKSGWNTLVAPDSAEVNAALTRPAPTRRPELYGGGTAGDAVVEAVVRFVKQQQSSNTETLQSV